jgi:condensin complex subunit 1
MADEDPVNFDLNESLKQYSIDPTAIETERAPAELVECETDPESLTPGLINSVLNPVVDAIATSPEAIIAQSRFDTLQFLLKCVPVSIPPQSPTSSSGPDCELFRRSRLSAQIPHATISKIIDLLTSAIIAQAELANSDLLAGEEEAVSQHKQLLEIYGFLLQWAVSAVEARAQEKPTSAPAKGRGKGSKTKTAAKDGNWDASAELMKALRAMLQVFKLHEFLGRIFVTTPHRDTFVTMFTKSAYHILENEARVKNTAIKEHCFGVLCTAVKHHGHAFGRLG